VATTTTSTAAVRPADRVRGPRIARMDVATLAAVTVRTLAKWHHADAECVAFCAGGCGDAGRGQILHGRETATRLRLRALCTRAASAGLFERMPRPGAPPPPPSSDPVRRPRGRFWPRSPLL
jgi:hypothetical protein